VVSPARTGWPASLWGGAVTGSFAAGFVQGVRVVPLPAATARRAVRRVHNVGGTVAVGLWLDLLHVLVLVGFMLTLRIDARGGVPWRRPDDMADDERDPAGPRPQPDQHRLTSQRR